MMQYLLAIVILSICLKCDKPGKSIRDRIYEITVTADKDYTAREDYSHFSFNKKVPYGTTEVTIKEILTVHGWQTSKKTGDKLKVGVVEKIILYQNYGAIKTYSILINAEKDTTEKSRNNQKLNHKASIYEKYLINSTRDKLDELFKVYEK